MPSDCRGIKKHARALQRGQARSLRIPLVPADQRTQASRTSINGAVAEVAGREVKLLVVEGVVRDMHLAVDSAEGAIGVEHRGSVVIHPRSAFFEKGCDEDDAVFTSGGGELFRGGAGNRLGQIEQGSIFTLAEVLCLKKFRQADYLHAAAGRICSALQCLLQVLFGIGAARHLYQSDAEFFRRQPATSNGHEREIITVPGSWLSGLGLSFRLAEESAPHYEAYSQGLCSRNLTPSSKVVLRQNPI